jgi:ubiquinone/menaquinone biosynthesis C-methylase UbiE
MNYNSAENPKPFSKTMTDILNYGSLNLAMAIGYRTRLFDFMDESDSPQSVTEIAEKSALNERYIKEWLGIMVCGGIVELSMNQNGEEFFFLPKSHGDLLTRRAGNANLGVYTQEIPLLTESVMEYVIQSFYTGEGIDYCHYPKFQAFMSQLANAKHVRVLVKDFLPAVDAGRILKKIKSGIRVCDLGCAEGVALILMAEAFPDSNFYGIDISKEAIQKAKAAAKKKGLKNVKFINIDAAILKDTPEFKCYFDYVTAFDAIHDQNRPLESLIGIYSILKTDGCFSMIDIAAGSSLSQNTKHPMGAFLYTVSLMHCMPVGMADGGAGLGMMWGREKAVQMLEKAGFSKIEVQEIPNDSFNLHFFCRK